ncbi:hypothetical protein [Kitasatospora sp. MAP12-44]|uniref:hypothetical protein n=1 Tax=unclassified Kitasatospora TaxID=2633591 RepID=UPI002474B90D|nr:hypothetical protein [Kitasatospora sp. MAP12-44]MDH6107954.1 hypothetical protein [Kitasatospora sp. MAP12-44]
MGRHRRPADPPSDVEKTAELGIALLAIAVGKEIAVEGVTVPPGTTTPYLYRRTYRPDGLTTYCMVRIADLPTYGFPPPDP